MMMGTICRPSHAAVFFTRDLEGGASSVSVLLGSKGARSGSTRSCSAKDWPGMSSSWAAIGLKLEALEINRNELRSYGLFDRFRGGRDFHSVLDGVCFPQRCVISSQLDALSSCV